MHSRSSDAAPRSASTEGEPTTDPLAAVIALLRPQAIFSKVIVGAGRWAVRYARHDDPGFCLVLEGGCVLELDELGVVELRAGDFLLLPATPGFTMGSERGVRPTPVAQAHPRELRHGSETGPPNLRMLGGYFRFDRANAQLVVRLLPSLICIRHGEPGASRLGRIAEMIAEEAGADLPGREAVLERSVELLLIEALRFQPRRAPTSRPEQGLLAGLSDSHLARPLQAMHARVTESWTVAELARLAGMSRAVFAERFTRVVGMPPMQYLVEWRMALARDLLLRERPGLAEVAVRVGYQSASAFSAAFSRHTGVAPSAFAQTAIAG